MDSHSIRLGCTITICMSGISAVFRKLVYYWLVLAMEQNEKLMHWLKSVSLCCAHLNKPSDLMLQSLRHSQSNAFNHLQPGEIKPKNKEMSIMGVVQQCLALSMCSVYEKVLEATCLIDAVFFVHEYPASLYKMLYLHINQ